MTHAFDVELALEYGLEEAIIIRALQFWIGKNRSEGINQYNGRTWTYDSYPKWRERLPYLTLSKLRSAMGNLVDKKVIIREQVRIKIGDATNWYAFDDEARFLGEYPHLLKTADGQASEPNGTAPHLRNPADAHLLKSADHLLKSADPNKEQLSTQFKNTRDSVPSERTAEPRGDGKPDPKFRTKQALQIAGSRCIDHYQVKFRELHPGLAPPVIMPSDKAKMRYVVEAVASADGLDFLQAENACKRLIEQFLLDDTPYVVERGFDIGSLQTRANALRNGHSNGSGSIRNSEYGSGGRPGANGSRGQAPGGRGEPPRRGDSRGRDLIREWSK